MGHARRGPKLLPEKLIKIREYLAVGPKQMAYMLEKQIESQDKEYRLHPGRVSEYERGKRQPALIVVLAYSYIAQVSMIALADDKISVDEFRQQLGTFKEFHQLRSKKTRKRKPDTSN